MQIARSRGAVNSANLGMMETQLMSVRHRHVVAMVILGLLFVLPTEALAAKPTPTPTPTAVPVKPTATPLPATAVPTATPVAPAEAQPAAEPTPQPTEPLPDDTFSVWHGVVREGGAYRRAAPSASAEIEEELDPGTPIRVDRWVAGSMLYPDVITWGELDPDDGGGYIFGGSLAGILPPEVPPAPEEMQDYAGTWVDVNMTLDVVTAYVDGQPAKMMLISPGRPGFETDTGLFNVRSKLLSQTMSGPGYVVPGVPHVQYFFGGEALHGRYWTLPDVSDQTSADIDEDGQFEALDSSEVYADAGGVNRGVAFGVPSSHGCVGMDVDAARWL